MPIVFPFTINGASDDDIKLHAKMIVEKIKPDWNIDQLKYKSYNDGITNKLMGVYYGDFNNQVLIRIYGNNTESFIDREAEKKNIQLLHKHDCAPPLYAVFNNGICYGFVSGTPFDVNSVNESKKWRSVAKSMATLHLIKTESNGNSPMLFALIRKLLSLVPKKLEVPSKQKRLDDLNYTIDYLTNEIKNMESHLTKLDSPVVLCHNDILLANIIWDDKTESVQFIDYEYAGPNYQAYDIGNHFNEFVGVDEVDYNLYPSNDYQKKWIQTYLSFYQGIKEEDVKQEDIEELWKYSNKFALSSHLLWGIWALVQAHLSSIDFDFLQYGIIRLNEYNRRKAEFLAL